MKKQLGNTDGGSATMTIATNLQAPARTTDFQTAMELPWVKEAARRTWSQTAMNRNIGDSLHDATLVGVERIENSILLHFDDINAGAEGTRTGTLSLVGVNRIRIDSFEQQGWVADEADGIHEILEMEVGNSRLWILLEIRKIGGKDIVREVEIEYSSYSWSEAAGE